MRCRCRVSTFVNFTPGGSSGVPWDWHQWHESHQIQAAETRTAQKSFRNSVIHSSEQSFTKALLLPSQLLCSTELFLLFRCSSTWNTYTLISICGNPYNTQLTCLLTTEKRDGVRGGEKLFKFSRLCFWRFQRGLLWLLVNQKEI